MKILLKFVAISMIKKNKIKIKNQILKPCWTIKRNSKSKENRLVCFQAQGEFKETPLIVSGTVAIC